VAPAVRQETGVRKRIGSLLRLRCRPRPTSSDCAVGRTVLRFRRGMGTGDQGKGAN